MTEKSSPPVTDQELPAEPEKTGATPNSQKAGSTEVTVLPAIRGDEQRTGLYGSNVASIFSALQNQSGQQLQNVLQIVGDGIDRQLVRNDETIEKVQAALRDETVAHARTDERLKNALRKSGTSAFLNGLGGAFLGYGLGNYEHGPGILCIVLGVLLLAVGCWPLFPGSKE